MQLQPVVSVFRKSLRSRITPASDSHAATISQIRDRYTINSYIPSTTGYQKLFQTYIMSRFQRLKTFRNLMYSKYLGITNVCTTCGLLCLGDVLIQGAEAGYSRLRKQETKDIDYDRTGRVFQVGIPSGIFSHVWYKNLDRLYPGRTKHVIMRKVFFDTALAGPCFLTIYFYGMSRAEGKSHKESVQVVKTCFLPVFTADICYWPLMQAANFYLIPAPYRILAISICQLFWNSFLSFVKHLDLEKRRSLEEQETRIVPTTEDALTNINIKQRATVNASAP